MSTRTSNHCCCCYTLALPLLSNFNFMADMGFPNGAALKAQLASHKIGLMDLQVSAP